MFWASSEQASVSRQVSEKAGNCFSFSGLRRERRESSSCLEPEWVWSVAHVGAVCVWVWCVKV